MALFSYFSKLEKKEQLFEKISLSLLIVLVAMTPIVYSLVPDKVIILGDNKAGALDSYNSRSALWLFPLVGVIIYLALSIQKHYLIKYRDTPAKGEEPEHTTTVWVLRLVKMIAMAGLIISVLEVMVTAAKPGSPMAIAGFVSELIIVAAVFTIAFKEVVAKYVKKS
jgi:hypothetical protein